MRLRPALAAILSCCALLAGCGTHTGVTGTSSTVVSAASSTSPSSAQSSSATGLATSSAAATVATTSLVGTSGASSAPASTIPAPAPKRIVSLSATATEDLFAIGAGSQVVAVDSDSNFPVTAPKTDLSAYKPNVEAIAKYQPDLVVLSDDINNIKAQLTKLSIPVLLEPAAASLDEAYRQVQSLGTTTGHAAEASRIVGDMKSAIATLVATVPKRTPPLTYFHELDNTLYTVSSKTFIGQVYALAGLKDVADSKGTAYPQLSAESLVKANPDLIFLADNKCCQQTAATFGSRPGFSVLSAVKDNHVVLLDEDVASRWGPRVVQLLKKIVDAVKSVRSS